MSDKDRLKAQLQGINSAIDKLEVEYNEGLIDIGRYLRLKQKYETSKVELERKLNSLVTDQQAPNTVDALRARLNDDDAAVRSATIDALDQVNYQWSLELLIQLSEDTDAAVRLKAVNKLGRLKDLRAVDALRARLNDDDPAVRSEANRSLKKLKAENSVDNEPPSPPEPPPIPRQAWVLLALLGLDLTLAMVWGWCLLRCNPNLMAYIQTVATVVGIPITILAIFIIVKRPIVWEEILIRSGTSQRWAIFVLVLTGLVVVVTFFCCLVSPDNGGCSSTPTNTPTVVASETVALITSHSRYVSAKDGGQDWILKGDIRAIGDWEKFTLLCLDNDKVALKTHHGRYVTAGDGQPGWDWKIRAEAEMLLAWEQFTLINAETEGDWLCQDALDALAQGVMTLSLKTSHGRFVTAKDGQTNWELRGDAEILNAWEKFLVVPLSSKGYIECRTGQVGEGNCPGKTYPGVEGSDNIDVCEEEISVQPPQLANRVYVMMTARATQYGYSLWEIEFYRPDGSKISLVTEGTPRAFSEQNDSFEVEYATEADDGMTRRWSSEHGVDPQWFEVTLHTPIEIGRIVLKWERAFAADYCVVVTTPD